jgi:rubrerythrin
MNSIFVKLHELWIVTLMASFMSKKCDNKRYLNDFSDIIFRHFVWLERELIKNGIEYDYNRESVPIKVDNLKVILNNILERINSIKFTLALLKNEALKVRIESDLNYIESVINSLEDEDVSSAFDAKRKYKNYQLSDEATDALTLFLFEESYKEYELILVYNYLKAHTEDDFLNKIFQILVDESIFHLKSFGEMMAEMGILAVPRVVHSSLYKVEDIEEFLKSGIDEEILAKEECVKLSEAVAKDSQELAKFFDFINNQESYHISLMREALDYFKAKEGS